MKINSRNCFALLIAAVLSSGCSGDSSAPQSGGTEKATGTTASSASAESDNSSADSGAGNVASSESGGVDTMTEASTKPTKSYRPVKLGGGTSSADGSAGDAASQTAVSTAPPKFEDIVKALKPLQIVLGNWTGILKNASTNEPHQWAWDLKTDPVFPALVLKSPGGTFFTSLRLTYDPRSDRFLMTTVDKDNIERKYEGEYKEPPKDIPSEDGKKVERSFKLQLTQVSGDDKLRYQFVINQQNNNRYLVEVHRARGTADYRLFDVIGTQRDGVSFAKADDDYGEQTCVISGGLGTMSVSYKGKSYPVCCTGCKAAFEEDPERWLARFNEQKMKKDM